MRQWLRSFSYWERDNSVPKVKWGVKLLHALDGPARRIADSVPSEEVLTDKGDSAILSALMLATSLTWKCLDQHPLMHSSTPENKLVGTPLLYSLRPRNYSEKNVSYRLVRRFLIG